MERVRHLLRMVAAAHVTHHYSSLLPASLLPSLHVCSLTLSAMVYFTFHKCLSTD